MRAPQLRDEAADALAYGFGKRFGGFDENRSDTEGDMKAMLDSLLDWFYEHADLIAEAMWTESPKLRPETTASIKGMVRALLDD